VRLQQTLGNRAVGALLNRPVSSRPVIQAKLIVNAPGDEYEREADRVADEVMRMPGVQRQEMDEDEKPDVMTKPLASSIQRPVMDDEELEEEEPEVMTKPEAPRGCVLPQSNDEGGRVRRGRNRIANREVRSVASSRGGTWRRKAWNIALGT
jgi:hypothetical protein